MTLALLESIIFNRITGPQSSPLTPATTLESLGTSWLKLLWAIEDESIAFKKGQWPRPSEWHTLQDVLNSFPEAEPGETGNP